MTDYAKYRGKCKEMCEELVKTNPSLKMVRGYYYCPISNKDEQHWWCIDLEGNIIDPTKKQFLSGGAGTYTEFDGTCTCGNCGKVFSEEELYAYNTYGNYIFCSGQCMTRFIL